jgi:hypothetical protein
LLAVGFIDGLDALASMELTCFSRRESRQLLERVHQAVPPKADIKAGRASERADRRSNTAMDNSCVWKLRMKGRNEPSSICRGVTVDNAERRDYKWQQRVNDGAMAKRQLCYRPSALGIRPCIRGREYYERELNRPLAERRLRQAAVGDLARDLRRDEARERLLNASAREEGF